jgi:hypothetical protein
LRFDFWRGIIAGGLLGVMTSILMRSQNKTERRNLLGRVYTRRPRSRTRQFIRGVTKSVTGMIK